MSSTTTTIRKSYGNRKLFTFPEDYALRSPKQRISSSNSSTTASSSLSSSILKKNEDNNKLLKYIDDNVIGKNNAFLGPFGRRKVVYCDYAASGRSLQFIEEYILREVLPSYGNTHSTTNITSLQSSNFRNEAREIIKNCTNASDVDAVIFTGHGCTDALQKLISALDLREPPIVFTGSSEHHDNLHLWQEVGAKMVRIAETKEGFLDLNDLENQLRLYQNCNRQMIGCFSVASNVTGIVIDDVACTILLHQYQALAFWDYNIAAPYINIDMNPFVPGVEENSAYKDAIYFSGHKFIGGIQTPGILIAKKVIFRRLNPCESDGFFSSQEYNKSFETLEEGCCAAVVESIRAGLVMQLKDTVTVANITQRQEKINKQVLQHFRTIPEIILLGNTSPNLKRVSVFSFMVRHPRGTYLHHNFVCAILNDVFGIQARAGCPCSGQYAQDLLGIESCLADQYENILLEDRRLSSLNLGVENSTLDLLRPGFTRISLPYFINDTELFFIMEAIKMVATEGWKLLPQYVADLETGEWRHHTNIILKDRKWLSSIRYIDGKMTMNERRISGPGLFPQTYSECLQTARNLFNRARKTANRNPYNDQGIQFDSRGEKLRWFMLQHEAQNLLTSNAQNVKQKIPFDPIKYSGSKSNEQDKDKDQQQQQQQQQQLPISNSGSPRHYSLPSIDDPKILSCSSPVPYFLQDVNGLYYPQMNGTSPVNFAVGETVNSANFQHFQYARERCFSLGTPNISPPILSPQTRVSLGMNNNNNNNNNNQFIRQRNLSYSSQNELHSLESSENNLSPTHSLNIIIDNNRGSPAPDIQTYVTEMTKELATNIKSEIREVINRVEDALENTDSIDLSCRSYCDRHGSGSEDGRSDSISANEVAEYIEKVSIEMANEVKSDIRDIVNAVDVFITPDNQERTYSRTSSCGGSTNGGDIVTGGSTATTTTTTTTATNGYTPGSSSETVIHLIKKSDSTNRLSDDEIIINTNEKQCYKNKILTSTVASVSSQDSGINLSFHEPDYVMECSKIRSNSESFNYTRKPSDSDFNKFSTLQKQKRTSSHDDEQLLTVASGAKWISLPKTIWQLTVEAIQEFEMIRNGDRVMVCLSGGKDSLSLLHALIQYQNYVQAKGLLFSLGAVTVDPDTAGCDICSLIPHLRTLGVHYIIDEKKSDPGDESEQREEVKENLYSFLSTSLRHRLYASAKSHNYNVLAIGQHLDDLCENFLLSAFHNGRLRAMRAHYYIKEHKLRVIRPFIYVRDKYLRQFVNNQNLPVSINQNNISLTKERQRIKQVLTQQEILFPKLFVSLRSALHPLICFQIKECEIKYTRRRLKSKENDTTTTTASSLSSLIAASATSTASDNETDEEPVVEKTLKC